MKPIRLALTLLFAALPLWLGAAAVVTVNPAVEKVYVQIDSPDLIFFHHYRLAQANGKELILDTLKQTAADQARFAEYPGELVVLNDGVPAPDGAPVLLLNWNKVTVTASLIRDGKENYLGVVSRTPYDGHPDYLNMRRELRLDRGLPDERRDADLRASTQMNLYQALRILRRHTVKG